MVFCINLLPRFFCTRMTLFLESTSVMSGYKRDREERREEVSDFLLTPFSNRRQVTWYGVRVIEEYRNNVLSLLTGIKRLFCNSKSFQFNERVFSPVLHRSFTVLTLGTGQTGF